MELDYQKSIDEAVFKKLNKLTINEIRIVVTQLQMKYKKAYSQDFYNAFVTNVRKQNENRVQPLYIQQLHQNFNNDVIETLKPLAQRYQKNQLNQAIRKQVNKTFDEDFKARLQALIRLIAHETMQSVPF